MPLRGRLTTNNEKTTKNTTTKIDPVVEIVNGEEMIQVWIPKKRMRRPFPLIWGIAALGVFTLFAISTQIQFSRVSDQKIYEARLDTFRSDERAYDVATEAYQSCVTAIQTRETYRGIFAGVSELFGKTADLPVELFPDSEPASAYQALLTAEIERLITEPVKAGLPPKELSDCPSIPPEPQRP